MGVERWVLKAIFRIQTMIKLQNTIRNDCWISSHLSLHLQIGYSIILFLRISYTLDFFFLIFLCPSLSQRTLDFCLQLISNRLVFSSSVRIWSFSDFSSSYMYILNEVFFIGWWRVRIHSFKEIAEMECCYGWVERHELNGWINQKLRGSTNVQWRLFTPSRSDIGIGKRMMEARIIVVLES